MKPLFFALLLTLPMVTLADQYDHRLIHTNGYGEVKVKPDIAKLSLSVEATRKVALDAKAEVDKRVNNLLAALKKAGIPQKDVIASSLRTNPQYEYSKLSSKRSFVGYSATRSLNVTVRKLNKLTDVMDLALKHDIQSIGHISYESSDPDKHINQARKNAIENSKLKAKSLAKAYGAEVGNIVSIQYHSQQANYALLEQGDYRHKARSALYASSASSPGTYLPDQITFSDQIQVTFDLIINN
ncbi:SIMPL domain-containing protein [bacterium SCSIO 12696]|nr:SIMPL domain-containing protein [bacterium SCSIO 12696]